MWPNRTEAGLLPPKLSKGGIAMNKILALYNESIHQIGVFTLVFFNDTFYLNKKGRTHSLLVVKYGRLAEFIRNAKNGYFCVTFSIKKKLPKDDPKDPQRYIYKDYFFSVSFPNRVIKWSLDKDCESFEVLELFRRDPKFMIPKWSSDYSPTGWWFSAYHSVHGKYFHRYYNAIDI